MTTASVQRHLLLEGIFLKYGFDFRKYTEASVTRRIEVILGKHAIPTEADLLARLLNDEDFFRKIMPLFTVNTSEMFRDPTFFKALRTQVIPVLRTYPNLNIWVAGCSTGEEVYSLQILLHEEGLLERSTIYATDINPLALKKAQDGVYDLEGIRVFTKNYVESGGIKSPSDYYTVHYNRARMIPELRERVVFSEHNMATGEGFVEAHLILCRNVLIYFNRELQERVFKLFYESLASRAFLGLGSKESIRFSACAEGFDELNKDDKIYQKARTPLTFYK
ncbi:protein-glutamate O-methyltransferase CheR [Bdellovibrio sp. ZAP7]|uniref:CheR family methyltransferase n=1 Tax=Bdellovibrio sp. ZAP7 TaxID=2231053 RepID=UPI00115A8BD0|nr:CheR family methyltransferase [Bdellovibrio sp. ZAP7]QDK44532.1 protein-glutamate O-methyltransferase CheR [Bdellovibrio sp. ZAP7]